MTRNQSVKEYINMLGPIPKFLDKYLSLRILTRLKKIGYFCGMDYATPHVYMFDYKISRYEHSLTTALITWRFTKNKKQTLAALFHDVSTPCFSHVIDYMNKDYENQESTEEKTESILRSSKKLKEILKEDKLTIDDILDFKNYTIVDNHRPKLCADRVDGIILTSLGWTKTLTMKEIPNILNDIEVMVNEYGEKELGVKSNEIANKLCDLNREIDIICHSNEDNYMMELLAEITKYAIDKQYITYDNLYEYNEEKLLSILDSQDDTALKILLNLFKTVTLEEISLKELPKVKRRYINPLVNGKRFITE
jgi:HD superfamily phosphohydrolase